jgi:hypothetical protein
MNLNSNHDLIGLEFALRIQSSNPHIKETYFQNLSQVKEISSILKDYSERLYKYKQTLHSSREILMTQIHALFDESFKILEEPRKEIDWMLILLERYFKSECEEAKEVIEAYRSEGKKRILSQFIQRVNVNVDEILDTVRGMIRIEKSYDPRLNPANVIKIEDDLPLVSPEAFENLKKKLYQQDKEIRDLNIRILEYQQEIETKDKLYSDLTEVYNAKVSELEHCKRELLKQNPRPRSRERSIDTKSPKQSISSSPKLSDMQLLELKLSNKQLRSKIQSQISKGSTKPISVPLSSNSLLPEDSNARSEYFSRNSGKRYLYIPESDSKNLIRYDTIEKTQEIMTLTQIVQDFQTTSTHELPSGDVFIAGFSKPVDGSAYLLKVATGELLKLPDLAEARYFISLCYHKNYVYLFGGCDGENLSNTAERYDIMNGFSHEILPDMKHYRDALSSVVQDDMIYLFWGSSNTIEVFHTKKMYFIEMNIDNSEVISTDCGIAGIYNDSIYLITYNTLQIFSHYLTKHDTLFHRSKHTYSSINNILSHSDCIYFYNHDTSCIERLSLTPEPPSEKYPESGDKYLYKISENSTEIHRIDIHTRSLSVINCSNDIHRNFYNTSICVLPNNRLFIAGFEEPISPRCYICYTENSKCDSVEDLPTPRYYLSMIYHEGFVYVFGGRNRIGNATKTVYRFRLDYGRWETLPDLKRPRSGATCVSLGNKIYVIAGSDTYIEIYDVYSKQSAIAQVDLGSNFAVSFVMKNLLYVIGDTYYMILDKDCKVVQEDRKRWKSTSGNYTLGNVIVSREVAYYYNNPRYFLEAIQLRNYERGILEINNLV